MLTAATALVLPGKPASRCFFEMRAVFTAALAALVLSACGSLGLGSTPSPTATDGRFDLAVSEKDKAATLHTGQKLEVVLHAAPNMANWTDVRSSDPAVLQVIVNPAATAARGVTLAAYQAVAKGHAQITATAAPDCKTNMACPQFMAVWSIEVTVTG
jgi:hypothetical protein